MVLMPRRPARARIAACLLLASLAPGAADPAPAIHYAPIENLEHVNVALIDRADHEIDMAAYVLTDWPVMQALTRAADRGVKVRIYLDGTQLAEREPAKVFNDLAETPGVEIRIKHKARDPMHLKSYQIDGRLLRTGAAAGPWIPPCAPLCGRTNTKTGRADASSATGRVICSSFMPIAVSVV
jgi:phosphatidylserine/phosphatidylglycerophosphate/cardiolipin synthase-like enzyme